MKIGLVAPFEGLYRQTGYAALEAMRAAIAATGTEGIEIMPLAMDSGMEEIQARRTVEKMLADPSVGAIVGPFSPETVGGVIDLVAGEAIIWRLPFLGGATTVEHHEALLGLLRALAEKVNANGERSIVLAGWTPGWPQLTAAEWTRQIGHLVRITDDPNDVTAGETVIWLGEAATGADYFARMRVRVPDVPFWLALAGDSPVFYQRAMAQLGPEQVGTAWGEVYWTAWLDDDYPQWAAVHTPGTPTAYAVYRATQAAIAQIAGHEHEVVPATLYVFQLTETGDNQRLGSHDHQTKAQMRTCLDWI